MWYAIGGLTLYWKKKSEHLLYPNRLSQFRFIQIRRNHPWYITMVSRIKETNGCHAEKDKTVPDENLKSKVSCKWGFLLLTRNDILYSIDLCREPLIRISTVYRQLGTSGWFGVVGLSNLYKECFRKRKPMIVGKLLKNHKLLFQ